MNFVNKLKEILISKHAKRFYWNVGNGFIGVLAVEVGNLDWVYAPVIIAALNGLTKYLNSAYWSHQLKND